MYNERYSADEACDGRHLPAACAITCGACLKTATPLFRDGARLRLHGCPAAESWKYCGEKLYSAEQCGTILLTLSRKL